MSDSGPDDDSSLLSAWLRHGCERSFRLLVDRYAGLVHQAAKRRSGDESIAAEASQATFILLARKARGLIGRSSLAGWLHVTAVHQSRNLQRRQMRETRKRQHLGELTDTSDAAVWEHLKPELDHALAGLSAPDREALLMRYYRSLSVKEIAGALGVSIEAAQKRLTRATERLRGKLSSRGCVLPASAIAAGLVAMAGDAKAGLSLAPSFYAKAMATTAVASPLTSIGTYFFMVKKTTLLTGAAVALIGVGTYAALREADSPGDMAAEKTGIKTGTAGHAALSKNDNGSPRPARERAAAATYPDLASKYGESRTNLSRHVVDGFLRLFDEMLAIGESPEFADGHGDSDSLGQLPEKLNLSDSQQDAAKQLIARHQKRVIGQARTLSVLLKEDPRQLIELTLAGDANARNQISREEYDGVVKKTAEYIERTSGLANLDIAKDLNGTSPFFNNVATRAGFEKILDPSQIETFHQLAAEKPPASDNVEQLTKTFPSMELEKLDRTLTSSRAIVDGFKKMLEGAKTLPEDFLDGE